MSISRMCTVDNEHMLWFDYSDDCTYVVNNGSDMFENKKNEKVSKFVLKFTSACEVQTPDGVNIAKLKTRMDYWEVENDLDIVVVPQDSEDFDGIFRVEAEFAKLYIAKNYLQLYPPEIVND